VKVAGGCTGGAATGCVGDRDSTPAGVRDDLHPVGNQVSLDVNSARTAYVT
jgi:hypothetical protein